MTGSWFLLFWLAEGFVSPSVTATPRQQARRGWGNVKKGKKEKEGASSAGSGLYSYPLSHAHGVTASRLPARSAMDGRH